jgi:pimeloyl-ACP methyl ester carboxylesterase
MKKYILFLAIITIVVSCKTKEKESVKEEEIKIQEVQAEPNIFVRKTTFPSKDSLLITADVYEVNGLKPTILLCHQAGFSRGEYKDTALKLNKLGYSCMAIDQRSGKIANDVKNETVQRALDKELPTGYMDAKQDIETAIDFMYNENGNQPVIIVGSSYSASLVLLIGKDNPKVSAVASFSPGEYLKGVNLSEKVKDYAKPVFVTSSQKEITPVNELEIVMTDGFLFHFKPNIEGIHGSRALWESTEGNDKYWEAFEAFLEMVKKEVR